MEGTFSWLLFMAIICFGHCVEDVREYTLEHRLSPNTDYTNRGSLECNSISAKMRCTVTNNPDVMSTLSTLNNEGLYYLQLCNRESKCIQTFIRQCQLLESNLHDTIEVAVSPQQEVVSITIMTPNAYCNGTRTSSQGLRGFKTTVEVIEPSKAPEPEVQFFLRQIEEEKKKKEKGESEDNRSFFAKYWMYIVPVVLILLVMDKGDQQQQ